jgi:hypothetical protein
MGDMRIEDGTVNMIEQETVTPDTLNIKGQHTRIPYIYLHVVNYRQLTYIPASRIIIVL